MGYLILMIIGTGALYLILGGREALADRVAELARLAFAVLLLAFLLK